MGLGVSNSPPHTTSLKSATASIKAMKAFKLNVYDVIILAGSSNVERDKDNFF